MSKKEISIFEIDHTKWDIFLIDESTKGLKGQPWITFMFDDNGIILDFHLHLEPLSPKDNLTHSKMDTEWNKYTLEKKITVQNEH
ncbi:hypothetical protein [Neobacillus massiliamazoniensis]|uniref:Uncharacterized protein n=1 Tax=Neobacillus massiliamazoniensis TaxID=1499688 RepID=A0A0U1P546_9BACI|nr:hypothetical protein [Neobacillus massiliamazoniensis]CRK85223.1 hypothetical protein BN000_05295 [Neobacillus massiliamazoniensis]